MIYTTYFANLDKINIEYGIPIAICGKSPDSYNGLEYKKFAPKWKFFKEWKENHDNDFYIEHFNDEVLSCLTQEDVMSDLRNLVNSKYGNIIPLEEKWWKETPYNIYLVCYEKPNEFCHRHLVARWLKEGGVEINELI